MSVMLDTTSFVTYFNQYIFKIYLELNNANNLIVSVHG